jgi:hypothetical protein
MRSEQPTSEMKAQQSGSLKASAVVLPLLLEKRRGPTSIRRGIILKTATLLHGLPSRVRNPFSFRSLTIWE